MHTVRKMPNKKGSLQLIERMMTVIAILRSKELQYFIERECTLRGEQEKWTVVSSSLSQAIDSRFRGLWLLECSHSCNPVE